MPVAITFINPKLFVGSIPLADLELIGPSIRFRISAVLVGSGADYLQIPRSAAIACGLFTTHTPVSVRVKTAGGTL